MYKDLELTSLSAELLKVLDDSRINELGEILSDSGIRVGHSHIGYEFEVHDSSVVQTFCGELNSDLVFLHDADNWILMTNGEIQTTVCYGTVLDELCNWLTRYPTLKVVYNLSNSYSIIDMEIGTVHTFSSVQETCLRACS